MLEAQASLVQWASLIKASSATDRSVDLQASAKALMPLLKQLQLDIGTNSELEGLLKVMQQQMDHGAATPPARPSSAQRTAPRGAMTPGQAGILGMRATNGPVSRSASSFAGQEAARARALQDEEQPWLNRYLSAMRSSGAPGRDRPLQRNRGDHAISLGSPSQAQRSLDSTRDVMSALRAAGGASEASRLGSGGSGRSRVGQLPPTTASRGPGVPKQRSSRAVPLA